ncbi:MAG: hypothetical protein HYS74_00015 [Parcubacteria group bacterium]|nr:hypothetical protein [Parcubacteria group bacterium]
MKQGYVFTAVVVALVAVFGGMWFAAGIPLFEPPAVISDRALGLDAAAVGFSVPTAFRSVTDADGIPYLTDTRGIALYTTTLAKCTGDCLRIWPPYYADVSVSDGDRVGTVRRTDTGQLQYTWNGQLLYYFNEDKAIGDTKGDRVNNAWFLARP